MDAWGLGNFENDAASDWAYQLFEPGNHLPLVEAALRAAADAADDVALDATTCCEALAAAEVIAAWLGRPSNDVNDTVTVWTRARTEPPAPALADAARTAAYRAQSAAVMREHHHTAGTLTGWDAIVTGLLERLA